MSFVLIRGVPYELIMERTVAFQDIPAARADETRTATTAAAAAPCDSGGKEGGGEGGGVACLRLIGIWQ